MKRVRRKLISRGRLRIVALGLAASAATSAAFAQPITGDPTCDADSFALPPLGIAVENKVDFPGGYPGDGLSGTWPTPDMSATRIDRRPVCTFNLSQRRWRNNDPIGNPLGLNPEGWNDDSADPGNPTIIATGFTVPNSVVWLRNRLESLYDEGWRRVILFNPAGIVPDEKFASGQWWTLSDVKRQGLNEWIRPWLEAHPDFSVGVWIGFRLTDECDLDMSYRRDPDSRDAVDMAMIYRNVRPWFDDAGISEYWFDQGSPVQVAVRTINSPDLADLKIGIEVPYAIDAVGNVDSKIPMPGSERKAPWVAALLWYENIAHGQLPGPDHVGITDGCIDNQWNVDPATTEYAIFLRSFGDIDKYWGQLTCQQGTNYNQFGGDSAVSINPLGQFTGVTLQLLEDWRDRGFVLWTNRSAWRDIIALVTPRSVQSFDPAIIAPLASSPNLCLADLDRNGTVDGTDIAILLGRWDRTDLAAIDGDLDYDGVIGSGDLASLVAVMGPCSATPLMDDICRDGDCP